MAVQGSVFPEDSIGMNHIYILHHLHNHSYTFYGNY